MMDGRLVEVSLSYLNTPTPKSHDTSKSKGTKAHLMEIGPIGANEREATQESLGV